MRKTYITTLTFSAARHFKPGLKCLICLFLSFGFCCLFSLPAYANNIKVSDVSLQNLDSTAGTVDIKFDVSWDNSFTRTDANGNAYFDRAWVFVKYQIGGTGAWYHATLVSGASLGSYSTSTAIGITSDGKGAFCRPGLNQTLRWSFPYGTSMDTIRVRVFAIEMVYIPQGSFVLGSGGTESGSFTDGSWVSGATIPFTISSENALSIAASAGSLWGTSTSGNNTIGDAGTLPAAFPKGYGGFYVMKYEVSQGQYRDFLNTLTYAQQATRTANAPSSAAGTGALINPTTYRNAIKIKTSGVSSTTPAVYGCDLGGNGTYDESDDGEWIACNYLSWADLMAYADWAGLRPMTELEFEKASRGPARSGSPTANEYAWGNTTVDYFSDLSYAGTSSEAIGPTRPNANCNYSSASPDGPVRCGMFATSSSSRTTAGASYYGLMEMSGNLWERCVTIGNATGRAFTGLHGNGTLDSSGNADVTNWPGTGATGSGYRGGSWSYDTSLARVSDRSYAAVTASPRYSSYGGRFARTP
ncbi:MAG: SUMF1/EgtB/PvdO family nonheme iron enzyme [Candidatus Omnitrophica bacterium]|nr:SUMF1/EgtB/PvdO family nonheme iron enzyme [Candidatus Omnitrophota bacterium]